MHKPQQNLKLYLVAFSRHLYSQLPSSRKILSLTSRGSLPHLRMRKARTAFLRPVSHKPRQSLETTSNGMAPNYRFHLNLIQTAKFIEKCHHFYRYGLLAQTSFCAGPGWLGSFWQRNEQWRSFWWSDKTAVCERRSLSVCTVKVGWGKDSYLRRFVDDWYKFLVKWCEIVLLGKSFCDLWVNG